MRLLQQREAREDLVPPECKMAHSDSLLLNKYVTKEFLKNFLVSFFFFFAIFFVNSILLLVQKILLKNISFAVMIEMVLLYMPQFLVYTFPFATLTSSSMVLGDMSSSNELLALRSLGIERKKVYLPLIVLSLILSICTFLISDILQPYTSVIYRDKLSSLMAEMPTMEIESNSTNSIGNIVLSNGKADGTTIEDIVLFTKNEKDYDKTVISKSGELELIDNYNYVYSLRLNEPELLISDIRDSSNYAFSKAESAIFYLDFSSQIPSLTSTSPVNLTSRELIDTIKERNVVQEEDRQDYYIDKENILLNLSSIIENGIVGENEIDDINMVKDRLASIGKLPVNFYGQYYKSELSKKITLSLGCFVLTLLTLPLSTVRVKHGKLTGFAIAILIAVAYWYMIFAVQLLIFDISFDPYILILLPDIFIALLAIILLYRNRRA